METIAVITEENTIVMSLMNGVDSEEMIAEKIGSFHLLYSVIKVAAHKEATGYYFNPETTIGIIFGELNVCNNLPQAVLGVGVGCYQDSVHMKEIRNGLRRELEAIAMAKGIDMSKVDTSSTHGSAVPSSARYSTLQDLDAKRHTEIEMFSGVLIRMGKELGIPVPYNEYTYHIIKAMEEKNDGKFDYCSGNEKRHARFKNFYKRNLDGNPRNCIIILTEPTTPLIFHAQPGGTFFIFRKS